MNPETHIRVARALVDAWLALEEHDRAQLAAFLAVTMVEPEDLDRLARTELDAADAAWESANWLSAEAANAAAVALETARADAGLAR